jgi:nicotinic acid mononucleotide adenylyltransferase
MISDNVFSDWLTSLVTFFEKMLYSPRVTSSTKLNQRKRRDKSVSDKVNIRIEHLIQSRKIYKAG